MGVLQYTYRKGTYRESHRSKFLCKREKIPKRNILIGQYIAKEKRKSSKRDIL